MVIYSYTNHKTYKNTNLKYDTLDNILKKEDYDQIEFLCFSQFPYNFQNIFLDIFEDHIYV